MIFSFKQLIIIIFLMVLLFGDVNKIVKTIKKNLSTIKQNDAEK